MPNAWMVRAGDDNELVEVFTSKRIVAIGWKNVGDTSRLENRDSFKSTYIAAYPDHAPGRVNVNVGQIYRFMHEMKVGDLVLTYDKSTRTYHVGEIASDARYDPVALPDYPYLRKVEWQNSLKRDELSPSAKNTLGSTMTVFSLDSCATEVRLLCSSAAVPSMGVPTAREEAIANTEENAPYSEEVRGRADELIADLISSLDAYDFQHLVAGILRAMGFRTKESDPGRDQGIDIIATQDAFGFATPRIKVQVKHRVSKSSGPDIRNFVSALDSVDNGIFISTGGFTQDAKTESLRAGGKITLMDRDGLIELMIEHYEKLEPQFQAMVPLVKVWLPVKT